jgi:gamma-glutamyltranspeptidase/glutathione hydrolase
VSFEPGMAAEVESAFRALGQQADSWPARNLFFGGVHAARRDRKGGLDGAGDPRRGGQSRVV